jgi:membrane protein
MAATREANFPSLLLYIDLLLSKSMLDKIRHYFLVKLWSFPLSGETGLRHFGFKWLRIVFSAARGFYIDKCSLSASSLTYYTLMSIIPVLAMAFAVSRAFGYNDVFRAELLQRFQDQNGALLHMFTYADAFLDQARGGPIAGVGLIILFLTVALLLNTLEVILNQIWGARKMRPWRRIGTDYFAFMLVAPILFVVANSASVFIVDILEMLIRNLPVGRGAIASLLFLINLIPYCLFWILFTFMYLFMPNTKVYFLSACLGGLVAACLYIFSQWIYIYFQVGVSHYGAVYGSMAALPLFLIWLQVSWFLFLFGAEISCAHQTLENQDTMA